MCTLIALHRCVPGTPLLIAANRDEYLDRPSEGPALRGTQVAAPLDLREGGTWLGVNALGVFAAITNRPGDRDDSRRSRGLLVMDVLASDSAAAAAARMERIPESAYNGFNLFVADAQAAFVAVYQDAPKVFALRPGAHVIGNADPNDRSHRKVGRILGEVEALAGAEADAAQAGLAAICRQHDVGAGPVDDTCIHAGRYGTRCSTLLRLPGSLPGAWRYADGAPCEHAYHDFDHLFTRHGQGAAHGITAVH